MVSGGSAPWEPVFSIQFQGSQQISTCLLIPETCIDVENTRSPFGLVTGNYEKIQFRTTTDCYSSMKKENKDRKRHGDDDDDDEERIKY
ncbi:hypothetical protein KPH14_004274 [Odynerus spinipes]|uniref:Uncharacterized protein n=1 Tax=Odynerus spinipes TaxID=1348599 RepID=A0AAD9VVD4_9HYME|nr:hypothetical protein KPH14_004274 [Odynerus spinipes]